MICPKCKQVYFDTDLIECLHCEEEKGDFDEVETEAREIATSKNGFNVHDFNIFLLGAKSQKELDSKIMYSEFEMIKLLRSYQKHLGYPFICVDFNDWVSKNKK